MFKKIIKNQFQGNDTLCTSKMHQITFSRCKASLKFKFAMHTFHHPLSCSSIGARHRWKSNSVVFIRKNEESSLLNSSNLQNKSSRRRCKFTVAVEIHSFYLLDASGAPWSIERSAKSVRNLTDSLPSNLHNWDNHFHKGKWETEKILAERLISLILLDGLSAHVLSRNRKEMLGC